jgi:hypothetical protein
MGFSSVINTIKQAKKAYHNVILDAMHCWTVEECKEMFKFLEGHSSMFMTHSTHIYILSNSNTVKDFGYDIVKDLARFLNVLSGPESHLVLTIPEKLGPLSEVVMNNPTKQTNTTLDYDLLQRSYYMASKNDEIFDPEARMQQWLQNAHRFSFLYENPPTETNEKSASVLPTVTHRRKRTLSMSRDTDENAFRVEIDGVHVESLTANKERYLGTKGKLKESLLHPSNQTELATFLSKFFAGRKIIIVVGYKVLSNYGDIRTLESIVKQNTEMYSEVVTFYNWCCKSDIIKRYKTTTPSERKTKPYYAILFFAIDDIYRLSMEVHQVNLDIQTTPSSNSTSNTEIPPPLEHNRKLTQPEIRERMCFAVNRAIEYVTGHIYFECNPNFLYTIYTSTSKDDGTLKQETKKTFFTQKGQKTSLLFEYLCKAFSSWVTS